MRNFLVLNRVCELVDVSMAPCLTEYNPSLATEERCFLPCRVVSPASLPQWSGQEWVQPRKDGKLPGNFWGEQEDVAAPCLLWVRRCLAQHTPSRQGHRRRTVS